MPAATATAAAAATVAAAAAVAALVCTAAAAQSTVARPTLTVCMAQDNAPLSHWKEGQPQGLDLRIAQAVAASLGRELRLVPFETQYEKESSLAQEVNALLSAGVCDAASGFALLAADLGAPPRESARVPDHPGAPRKRERPFVKLGHLVPSQAYLGAALGAVMRTPVPDGVDHLRRLRSTPAGAQQPWRIAAISGSLAGTLVLGWNFGALRPQLVSLAQNDNALQAVAEGRADVALVPLAQWDGWRLAHPQAPLAATPLRRPIGVNLGFVMLQQREDLRAAFNTTISAALQGGQLRRWAEDEGVSWVAPQAPDVAGGFSLPALLAD